MTALLTVAEATGAGWVACARTDGERRQAGHGPIVIDGPGRPPVTVHYAQIDPAAYHLHYSVISNPLLWFIQHYLWDLAYEPIIDDELRRAWTDGYATVNQEVGKVVAEIASWTPRPPLILLQDYHLYLAPRTIRKLVPQATLQQFVHIPWPTSQYWRVLPPAMRDAIVDGLLGNDIVGFQSGRDVRNFLSTCQENMGLQVDFRARCVHHRGRVVWVRAYPISVDVPALERLGESAGVAREEERLAGWRHVNEKLIVRVDRTDPAKNIVRGFLAYERLLLAHPELTGRVQFWAFLQPSRQDVASYREYLRTIRQTAARINSALGKQGWLPIRLELGENLRRAVAAYRNFDVLLVNPIYDGMNLVAKEGMLLNRTAGVLVLSENAGAHEELGPWALTVNPFDVDRTAQALHEALSMPVAQKRRRGDTIRELIRVHDIDRWIGAQVEDVRELVGDRVRDRDDENKDEERVENIADAGS